MTSAAERPRWRHGNHGIFMGYHTHTHIYIHIYTVYINDRFDRTLLLIHIFILSIHSHIYHPINIDIMMEIPIHLLIIYHMNGNYIMVMNNMSINV